MKYTFYTGMSLKDIMYGHAIGCNTLDGWVCRTKKSGDCLKKGEECDDYKRCRKVTIEVRNGK